jgi:phage/plasmid-like protein (TIGR03299 family)
MNVWIMYHSVYQNDEMFEFMDNVMKEAGSKIETCGSLRNGRTVWALAKAGTVEYLAGDPVDEYFLFRNGFDGFTSIELCFTTVRVVCNNTLTMALKEASNLWKIRHTESNRSRMEEVSRAIGAQCKYSASLKDAMSYLLTKAMEDQKVHDFFTKLVTPPSKREVQAELKTLQLNIINKMDEIYYSNALGMDVSGVRGTAYGALQAVTAWADHYRVVRAGDRDKIEARFESNFMGSAAAFKADAFGQLMAA